MKSRSLDYHPTAIAPTDSSRSKQRTKRTTKPRILRTKNPTKRTKPPNAKNPDATDLPEIVDDRPRVKVAGRVVLARDNGKLIWLNLRDYTSDTFQVAVSKRDCDEQGFALAKKLDVGDIVIAEGPLTRTNTGEVTCWADTLLPASKCLVPPPEKHAGLTDTELRYRQRYIDMWVNPETTRVFVLRSKMMKALRSYLDQQDFVEVDTPVLQTQAGGAAARPFFTHMNALGIDLSLRIAPELYLKRLLVGGMPRVYEVSRNFRNEGLDKSHNPEFTSLELYQAFGNYETMREIAEGLVRELAVLAAQETGNDPKSMPFGDLNIDYGSAFVQVTYRDLFKQALGFEFDDIDRAREEATKRGIKTKSEDGSPIADIFIINELFEDVAEASIDPNKPTFVLDYPAALSPLTRPKAETVNDKIPLADRWDLFIGGMEIGPAYTELNDPDIQDAKFREATCWSGRRRIHLSQLRRGLHQRAQGRDASRRWAWSRDRSSRDAYEQLTDHPRCASLPDDASAIRIVNPNPISGF